MIYSRELLRTDLTGGKKEKGGGVMSEPLVKHEIFQYHENESILIVNIHANRYTRHNLLNHWHDEMEITYILDCDNRHYIDGQCIQAEPGRLIVTNPESIHNIVEGRELPDNTHIAVMLILSKRFLEKEFPDFRSVYFTNQKKQCRHEIKKIMLELSEYADRDKSGYLDFYIRGLILQLFYFMSQEGVTSRDLMFDINYLKNIERLKGVFSYVETHYSLPIRQAEVAEKFYFTKEYFARYFKKCTGMTFMKYVSYQRVQKAQKELVTTDKSVLEIALNNGFSDDRGLINAFKEVYHTTPLQYRKLVKKRAEDN